MPTNDIQEAIRCASCDLIAIRSSMPPRRTRSNEVAYWLLRLQPRTPVTWTSVFDNGGVWLSALSVRFINSAISAEAALG